MWTSRWRAHSPALAALEARHAAAGLERLVTPPGPVGRIDLTCATTPHVEVRDVGDLLHGALHSTVTPLLTPQTFNGQLRPYQERGAGWLTFLGRLGLGACGGMRCAARCGQIVAEELGLPPSDGMRQARAFLERQARMRIVAMGPEQARQEALALAHMRATLGTKDEP